MTITEALHTSCIKLGSTATDRESILKEIAALAARETGLKKIPEKKIFQALLEREKLSSTGFGKGIAIPHCALDKAEKFVVGIVTVPQGINFDAIDDEPVKIFFFILGPKEMRNQHIKILSEISNVLKIDDCLNELMSAGNPDRMRRTFLSHVNSGQESELDKKADMCQFIVHIQNEDYFNDILEVLTSEVEGSLSVVDSVNAGFYLNKMPLFSSYWTDSGQRFSRMLIAVVQKSAMNDIIRRISMIVPDLDSQNGVLITVQDLVYTTGSIDF